MKKYLYFMAIAMVAAFSLAFTSCGDDNDEPSIKVDYDVLQINGESYACYGYRCAITNTSSWDLSNHCGTILLPCGKLSDAKKGEYAFDYAFSIDLNGGDKDLKKGSKLEDFSPTFDAWDFLGDYDYVSGSAIVTDMKSDKYITIKFESLKFQNGSKSYTLNGTVQLTLDED